MEKAGGWGWLVVASSFYANLVIGLVLAGFSILYVEWLAVFQSDTGSIGWIGSINLCSGNLLGLFFGVLVESWGCRVVAMVGAVAHTLGFLASSLAQSVTALYITFGVIGGLGSGLTMLTSNVVVLQHFGRNRALASAISLSGVSLGTLIAGPFFVYLIDAYGWRGALLLLSGLSLNLLPVALTYRPPDQVQVSEESVKARLKRRFCDVSLCSQPAFLLCIAGNLFMALGHFPVYAHTPNRALHYGVGRSQAAMLPLFMGVASLFSRLVFGCIANLPNVNRILQYSGGILVAGLLQLFYAMSTSYLTIALFCGAFGAVVGAFLTVQSTVLVDLVGIDNLPKAQGALFTVLGIGSLVGTPLAGYVFDYGGRYDIPFFMTGAFEIIGSLFIFGAALYARISKPKTSIVVEVS